MDHATEHEWEIVEGPHDLTMVFGVDGPNSDVYLCRRCGQMCLAEVGGPPDEPAMGDLLDDCGTAVARSIMET
jgi:hypothetical protein